MRSLPWVSGNLWINCRSNKAYHLFNRYIQRVGTTCTVIQNSERVQTGTGAEDDLPEEATMAELKLAREVSAQRADPNEECVQA